MGIGGAGGLFGSVLSEVFCLGTLVTFVGLCTVLNFFSFVGGGIGESARFLPFSLSILGGLLNPNNSASSSPSIPENASSI